MSSCDDRWECQAQIIDQVRAIYYGIWDGSQTERTPHWEGKEGNVLNFHNNKKDTISVLGCELSESGLCGYK